MYDVKSKHLKLEAKPKLSESKDEENVVKKEPKQNFYITNNDLFLVNNFQKLLCLTKRCMNKKKLIKIKKFFDKIDHQLSEDLSLDKLCSPKTIDLDSSDD